MPRHIVYLLAALAVATTLPAAAMAARVTVTGYLADNLCVNRGVGLDGANMATNPSAHTMHCNLLNICVNSGFCILTRATPTADYTCAYVLDAQGNNASVAWMRTQDYGRADIRVTVIGDTNTAGRLNVASIIDARVGVTTATAMTFNVTSFGPSSPPPANSSAVAPWSLLGLAAACALLVLA